MEPGIPVTQLHTPIIHDGMMVPGKIWGVRLSSSADWPETNSSKLIKASIYNNEDDRYMVACEFSRKVLEDNGEWLLKLARRVEHALEGHTKSILINYGLGQKTLVVLDDAVTPTNVASTPEVMIDLVVAKESSDVMTALDQKSKFGVTVGEDILKDHVMDADAEDDEDVCIYLHLGEVEYDEDNCTSQAGISQNRIIRLWSKNDDRYSLQRIHQEEENFNQESQCPSETNPAPSISPKKSAAANGDSFETPLKETATQQIATSSAKGETTQHVAKRNIPKENSSRHASAPQPKTKPSVAKSPTTKTSAVKTLRTALPKAGKVKAGAKEPRLLKFDHPQEVLCLYHAFNDTMTDELLKAPKKGPKAMGNYYKAAKKIMENLGVEVVELDDRKVGKVVKAASPVERSKGATQDKEDYAPVANEKLPNNKKKLSLPSDSQTSPRRKRAKRKSGAIEDEIEQPSKKH